MTPQDLRIGNYIEDTDQKTYAVIKSINKDNEWAGGYELITDRFTISVDTAIAIPLSEQWLIDLGGQKNTGWDGMVYYRFFHKGHVVDIFEEHDSYTNDQDFKIDSVHHLQNYIYNAIGLELIKEYK